ncbi:hypothetical protein VB711_08405 [Cronbergia sp. UHCC 0137]|uniref:hypothetical protein n=1 Tax=Cronbergia sp. UHCC 0137 TaxID=3110239 RepID=UPI002B20862C|nr:hypothetical protein [Cronbergia sp. UHCC 0137]MEA5617859.1 hypothetical protein [Cronbergia sp. UHCC 0137]
MLKTLLLSGWFRVKPFLNYVIIVMLITPLVGVSLNSTSATQSGVGKILSGINESDFQSKDEVVARVSGFELDSMESLNTELPSVDLNTSGQEEQLLPDIQSDFGVVKDNSLLKDDVSVSQSNLIEKIKTAKIQALRGELGSRTEPSIMANVPQSKPGVPVSEEPSDHDAIPVDPLGSPHPIPWKWIMMTQESLGGQGGSAVRYYRSVPVVSPDGRYAIYSRVQIEVKPEMHNSRVSSVLFIEDKQTKRLKVMTATAPLNDPLLKREQVSAEEMPPDGSIGVLVPVSWSEKSDRFLARKFIGIFNTADLTDHAVIWERQENHIKTVAPAQAEDDHEKIAILLGWSKSKPNNVLFRSGEMGEENWPLVQVATDGKTVNVTNDGDQAVTFGERAKIWAEPQVASR